MRNLINIFLLLPFLALGQTIPDKKYHAGAEISKTYHGGVEVWSATPTNLYTLANAANPDNEVNAITGTSGNGTWTSVATTPTPQNGARALKWTASSGGQVTNLATLTSMPVGVELTIKMYVYVPSGQGTCQIYLLASDGWVSETVVSISTFNTWHEITLVGITDASTLIIKPYLSSGGASGQWMAFDNIRITQ